MDEEESKSSPKRILEDENMEEYPAKRFRSESQTTQGAGDQERSPHAASQSSKTPKPSAMDHDISRSEASDKRSTTSGSSNESKHSPAADIPVMTLNEDQKARLERAKAYAKEMQPILRQMVAKSSPSTPPSTSALLASLTGVSNNQAIAEQRALSILSRIWIGSINFELDETHVQAGFSQFGEIKSISMSPIDPATGRHKGYCFIQYETPEAAQMALEEMDGQDFGGRQLKVGRPNNFTPMAATGLPEPNPARLYISNINEHISEENMSSIFEAFGTVKACVLVPNLITRKHKGYGFIEFEDASSAETAKAALNNLEVGGLKLRLFRAIVGTALPEGMKALDKAPNGAVGGLTAIPAAALSALDKANATVADAIAKTSNTREMSSAQAQSAAAARIAQDLVARNRPTYMENVALEENVAIGANQRLSIMQKLAASREAHSPVLLVRNAVPISEVDQSLQEDFAEECGKQGKVTKVIIKALAEGNEEAESAGLGSDSGRYVGDGDVRIFVQYAETSAAQRAQKVFDGRWFGGRRLKATLYDLKKFQNGDYWS
ncbi:hypothetical protein BZG36_02173 [Bifiguratus adelaidae]|uniref:RRM domain-containing protein n=1 Tax=Bifiguratus adelaidae TaxID=1938954 RepID=A0A261Y0R4_9FUNG|nr:hypothetical protein BZG36_02173 [Bifiguratus adelaidae]